MLFLNKKEVNYELYYKNTFIRMLINKKNYSNKYILNKKPNLNLFFRFEKIKEENLNLIKLFNHCIFFWLISFKIGIIKHLKVKLHRGVRYYRYRYICKIDDFFKILNFINETFTSILHKNTIHNYINNNIKYLNSYSDLSMFTNLKLMSSLYLNSIHDKLFLEIYFNKKDINLKVYLNCLKLK